MRQVNDWDNVQAYAYEASERLPAGGYVAQVLGAKVVTYNAKDRGTFEKLEICLDVSEGEYADFFKNQYAASTYKNKKMKGVYRCYVPTNDGSDNDLRNRRTLKSVSIAFEESNNGYHWDWDENKLKGLTVGMLVRDTEYDIDGKQGMYSEISALIPAQRIREGKFQIPSPRMLPKPQNSGGAYGGYGGYNGYGNVSNNSFTATMPDAGYPAPPPLTGAAVQATNEDYPF